MSNHSNTSASDVLDELRHLLFLETLTTDTINSDSGFQSNLAALLNSPAIIPSTHLAPFLTSLSTLNHDLRSACTQFFAMDLFAFISRSACVPSADNPTWSDSERTALDFVIVTMLQDDQASAREVLLAVQQRLMQVRAQWVEAMDASGEDVGYESASEDEDEAQGGEQVEEEEEQPLDRQAVFVLVCGLHAYYHAMTSPTAKKRSASLHSDLLSAWLPLRALTSSPTCARLFLASASAITSRLLALTDPAPQSFALRILGHFVGLLPASDPLVQHLVAYLKCLSNLIDTLVPSVAVEDHILVALVIPTAADSTDVANTHFGSLLDTIGGLMLSPVHQHWHLAHSLLAYLAALPRPASPSASSYADPIGDFCARHWLPFLSAHCTDPALRTLVARAGNLLLSTYLTEAEQATVLAALVHASPYANGKCMLIGSVLQPRLAANPQWAGGWAYVREALVPSMQRDVGALVDVLAGGGGEECEAEVAGQMMAVLAWVQFAYVLVKGGADEDAKEVLRSVVVGPLARLDERDMVPPVVGFAVGGLREALGDAE